MFRINTLDGRQRMSTQELLQQISTAVENGETEFHINASGQHDIGGPLWNREGKQLNFVVSNPGQRVGCMCMPDTRITVEGSAPADVGWLNSGGTVIIKGDAGDTAGHCAASGSIYIGGRTGTRSGSLMKHDPQCSEPELWILKSTGSFSFEFMSGGKAVICGHDCLSLPSVLGDRPCVGMVGGVVYFRGSYGDLPPDVDVLPLDDEDIAWLSSGLDRFLDAISATRLKRDLSLWKHWHKLVPSERKGEELPDMANFHVRHWFAGGLFGDILKDDGQVLPLVPSADARMREPVWDNAENRCNDCKTCLVSCPRSAILRRIGKEEQVPVYSVNTRRCIGCCFCIAVCPQTVWKAHQIESD